MNASCQRWIAIDDREATGETISPEDALFRRTHAAECEECAREARLWSALAEAGAGAEDAGADVRSEDIDRIVREAAQTAPAGRAARSRSAAGAPRRVLPFGTAAAGTALALAAAVVLFVRGSRHGAVPADAPPVVTVAPVLLVSGEAMVDGVRATAGRRLAQGATLHAEDGICLDLELDVHACLERGSDVRIADTRLAHRVLYLDRGHLVASLGHQPAGATFAVATSQGTATAIGTSFSVDVTDGAGPVVVRVTSGVVAVRATGGSSNPVGAGEEIVMGTSLVTRTEGAPVGRDAGLSASVVPPDLAPPPSGAAPPVASARPAPSVEELLAEARNLRTEGKFRQAADAYERLSAAHPTSAEAHASLVSLGDLELSHLQDPEAALRDFDAYLATGGVLSEEASFGRIGALRALGRSDDEQRALRGFLAQYPSSLHEGAVRARVHPVEPPR